MTLRDITPQLTPLGRSVEITLLLQNLLLLYAFGFFPGQSSKILNLLEGIELRQGPIQ